jgi:hypothetical protein
VTAQANLPLILISFHLVLRWRSMFPWGYKYHHISLDGNQNGISQNILRIFCHFLLNLPSRHFSCNPKAYYLIFQCNTFSGQENARTYAWGGEGGYRLAQYFQSYRTSFLYTYLPFKRSFSKESRARHGFSSRWAVSWRQSWTNCTILLMRFRSFYYRFHLNS